MNRSISFALLAAALLAAGCHAKTTEYSASDGSVTATLKGDRWTIADSTGAEVVTGYDSMRVVEVSDDGHPMTVVYYKGNTQRWMQYYSTMRLRSDGMLVDGKREGRWVYYHPNGNVQSEATFAGGREEGPYRVYRDNGAPYYIGQYTAGQPSGQWEVYDPEGNLVEKTAY